MENKRVVLVTGASRGIGAETAVLLASRGYRVAVNYMASPGRANEVVQRIEQAGGEAWAIQADVRSAPQVERLVGEIAKKWGTVDVLVNNASMSFAVKPFREMAWDEFSQKLNDEMGAAFILTKTVATHMVKNGYGRIVYIASGLARRPTVGMIAHGTAKAALVQFARFIAQEFGPQGITANVISPGLVDTEATAGVSPQLRERAATLTPLGRIASAQDVAGAIAMVVGDDARFITGAYVPVNGGNAMD